MADATAELRIAFDSAEAARSAMRALEPDNDGFLVAEVDGSDLILRAAADTASSVIRSIDDALACLRATGIP